MFDSRYRPTGRMVFGVIVIALGVLFTLDSLNLAQTEHILRWWPALLVLYGLARLTGFCCLKHTGAGVLFTLAGVWMLLHEAGAIPYGLWDLWPVALIILGGSIVAGALGRQRDLDARRAQDSASELRAFAFMSGVGRKVVSTDFRGGEVTAIMGGHDLDLRGAQLQGGQAVLDLFVMWGGVDILVPEDWKVSCEALVLMGGVEDNTRPPAAAPSGHLVLRGLVLMGGVDVKNRP